MAMCVSHMCRGILNQYHGTRKTHKVKNNKDGGMFPKSLMWLMNRMKKLKEIFGIKRDFRYNISFIDPF